jgi:hypothetical protein
MASSTTSTSGTATSNAVLSRLARSTYRAISPLTSITQNPISHAMIAATMTAPFSHDCVTSLYNTSVR